MTAELVTINPELTVEINQKHRSCVQQYENAVGLAVECGQLLKQVKDGLDHGKWLPWLEQNFEGSRYLAADYMRLAANVESSPHLIESESIDAAMKAIAKPKVASKGETSQLLKKLDKAQDDLKAAAPEPRAVATLDDAQQKRLEGAVSAIEKSNVLIAEATTANLSPSSAAQALRDAGYEARKAAVALEDLASQIERNA